MALTIHLNNRAVAIALTLGFLFELPVSAQPVQLEQNSIRPEAQEAPRQLSTRQQVLTNVLAALQSFAVFSDPNPPKYVPFPHLLRALRPDAIIVTLAKLKDQFEKSALKTNNSFDGKHLLLLASTNSIRKSRNGQTELSLGTTPNGAPFLTITLAGQL